MKACLIACTLACLPAFAVAQPTTMKLIADTVVDPAAWTFATGNWGTTVNGQTFQQEAVLSHKGYQYASYFADGGVLTVARRKLADGKWETIHFPDYTAKDHKDSHNVHALGIAEGDGTIHLAFDHHVHPLHYRRSVKGLASDPAKFDWKAEHFSAVTDTLDGIGPIKDLTYPHLFSSPGGKLQMLYRVGYSGKGDWFLVEYDPAKGWSRVGRMLAKEGDFQVSPHRCAYPNPIRYDAKGVLHVTWCWRETPRDKPFDLGTNHDILYAYSEDQGRNWKNNGGNVIADITGASPQQPDVIGINTMGTVAVPTRWLWGQMNTNTQTFDHLGRVHLISWQLPPEAKEKSKDMNQWRYFHYWRDDNGTWRENRLPFNGRKPQIVFDKAGNAIVVCGMSGNLNYHNTENGTKLTVMVGSAASQLKDWKKAAEIDRLSIGEPLLDQARWAGEGVLSVYFQDKPEEPGKASALRVIDFKPE